MSYQTGTVNEVFQRMADDAITWAEDMLDAYTPVLPSCDNDDLREQRAEIRKKIQDYKQLRSRVL